MFDTRICMCFTLFFLFSIMPTVTIGTDTTTVIKGEEAVEVPQIIPLVLETPLITEPSEDSTIKEDAESDDRRDIFHNKTQDERWRIFQKIGEQEFEDIVFTPERKSKKLIKNCINGNERTGVANDTANSFSEPNFLSKSMLNNNHTEITKSSPFRMSLNFDIEVEVENLLRVVKEVPDGEQSSINLQYNCDERSHLENIFGTAAVSNDVPPDPIDCLNRSLNDLMTDENNENTESESIDDEDESYRTELEKLQELGECTKQILQRKFDQSHKTQCRDDVDYTSSGSSLEKGRNYDLETQFNGG